MDVSMAGLAGLSASTPAASAAGGQQDDLKKADAAKQFEALLISQMLRSAHEAGGGGWMGEDQSASALCDMAEQQFAALLADGGGIGLAKMVKAGLARSPAKGAI